MHCLTLSFDNGPFPDVTPSVLDVLRAPERRAITARAKAEIVGSLDGLVGPAGAEMGGRKLGAEGTGDEGTTAWKGR